MKRFFALFLSVGMIFSYACSEKNEEPVEPAAPLFNLTSEAAMEFTADGGAGEITYSLENPVSGTNVTATSKADWITDITVGETITFTVAPNEDYDERAENITVSYGDISHTVSISQQGKEWDGNVDLTLEYMWCQYFDTVYSDGETLVYWIALSDQPMTMEDDNIENAEGSIYYQLPIQSKVTGEAGNWTIPNGTYSMDKENNENDTMVSLFSMMTNREGRNISYKNATVTVSDNRIVAILEFNSGEKHRIVHNGPTKVTHIPTPRIGNLYRDYNFDMNEERYPNRIAQNLYYGYNSILGCHIHQLNCVADFETTSGLFLQLELLNDNKTSPEGVYTQLDSNSSSPMNKFAIGDVDENSYIYGSWMLTLRDGVLTPADIAAPLRRGTITVTVEDDTCTVEVDCYDEVDHHINGTYTGPYYYFDQTKASAPVSIMRMPQ